MALPIDVIETELFDLMVRDPNDPRIEFLKQLRTKLRPSGQGESVSSRDYDGTQPKKLS